jgi:hypothetical protein
MSNDIPVIDGPGHFDIHVVGESHYLTNFEKICGTRRAAGANLKVRARLILEDENPHDVMAVRISVDGYPVGYLPSDVARDFRKAVIDGDLSEYPIFECAASIVGGWDKGNDNLGHYAIKLDLPQDDNSCPTIETVADPDDDPLIHFYRKSAVTDRHVDELIGIVKGVMADGIVTQGEVDFLVSWMDANRQAAALWPAKALYPRLAAVAAKGSMSLSEESELLDMLMRTVGGNTAPQNGMHSNSTQLPLSTPALPIAFKGQVFCFTGAFNAGTRAWCTEQVLQRGGIAAKGITKKLNYLVIGDVGNENWLHSTHGRKIEKAVEYIGAGCGIYIMSEEHWWNHL